MFPLVLSIRGRGKLGAVVTCDAGRLTIRLDDDANPEFWAEVTLDANAVRQLLDERNGKSDLEA
jgi:hypothetical protein